VVIDSPVVIAMKLILSGTKHGWIFCAESTLRDWEIKE
jgi:hypothetical protein